MAEMKDLVEQLGELKPALSEVGNPPHTFAVELIEQENEPGIHIRYDVYLSEEGAQELIARINQQRNNESFEVQKLRDWFSQLKSSGEESEYFTQMLDEIELHVEELDEGLIGEDEDEDYDL